jgi:hypothetical protein
MILEPFPAAGVYHNETTEMTALLVSLQAENIRTFTPFGDECHLDEVVQTLTADTPEKLRI